jgi:hypothetical protein
MTQPVNQGGIGFDAVWYMAFYHNLNGDGNERLREAKIGPNATLRGPLDSLTVSCRDWRMVREFPALKL